MGSPRFPAPPAVSTATAVAMVLLGKQLVRKRVDPRPLHPPKPPKQENKCATSANLEPPNRGDPPRRRHWVKAGKRRQEVP